jgi:hypothetical protein
MGCFLTAKPNRRAQTTQPVNRKRREITQNEPTEFRPLQFSDILRFGVKMLIPEFPDPTPTEVPRT